MISQKEIFTKYETARILGARALQIALDAPLLIKIEKEKLEDIRYDPLKIAELEFNSGVLPITVNRPMPKIGKSKIKKEISEVEKVEDKDVEKKEVKEVKEIVEEGEIMELAKPEDEAEEEESGGEEGI